MAGILAEHAIGSFCLRDAEAAIVEADLKVRLYVRSAST